MKHCICYFISKLILIERNSCANENKKFKINNNNNSLSDSVNSQLLSHGIKLCYNTCVRLLYANACVRLLYANASNGLKPIAVVSIQFFVNPANWIFAKQLLMKLHTHWTYFSGYFAYNLTCSAPAKHTVSTQTFSSRRCLAKRSISCGPRNKNFG